MTNIINWLLEGIKTDIEAIYSLEEFTYIKNKKSSELAISVKQKPNKFVPTNVNYYENKEIELYELTNEPHIISDYFIKKRSDKKCTITKNPNQQVYLK
jgi:hypothetical protein